MTPTSYHQFLQSKLITDRPLGIDISVADINPILFHWQRKIVRWTLHRGRAAIFADCGLGKTFMQLEVARLIPGRTLIMAPLAVAHQTIREARKLNIQVTYARRQEDAPTHGVTITNYDLHEHFDLSAFHGIILDESSILKSYMGKTKRAIVEQSRNVPFRLACTATPAPNDHMELGNHAEFLGVMDSNEMLARWFINDTMQAGAYRLKKHGAADFWRWVSGWAVSLSKPSDIGAYDDTAFKLPPLTLDVTTIATPVPEGHLFHTGDTLSATQIHKVKRETTPLRAQAAAQFAQASADQCLIWCDANYEADAVKELLPEAIDVRGSDTPERKAQALDDFADGKTRILITKPSLAGFGMNFQNCHRIAFVGLSYSFEAIYQAIRRVWRFGQIHPVHALIIETESETGIRDVVERKMTDHETMKSEMVKNMNAWQLDKNRSLTAAPEPVKDGSDTWTVYNGDCVEVASRIPSNTIDFSIFSPPFSNLYIYSDSQADMGNSADDDEFFAHFRFLISELFRITVNGRLAAIHCKDLPAYKGRDGAAGLIDFPGRIIREFEACGWQFHSRVTIWKDPITEMQRTKNHGLLHKQLCKDSAASRQGMADYLITFRKWDGDEFPNPVTGYDTNTRFEPKAHPYIGEQGPVVSATVATENHAALARDYSIQVWQRYASPVWFDIRQQRVLQGHRDATAPEDEKHICPLQLDVIERAIQLWTNPGDLIFSPFTGIGSEGYCAIEMGRRFIGAELKESYWKAACRNIREIEATTQADMFGQIENAE